MLTPLSETKVKQIIKACVNAAKDISKLNKTSYNYLYLASGFIAHYNMEGFRHEYKQEGLLKADILRYKHQNTYDNFKPGEENYDYYHQKAIIYQAICDELENNV